MPRWWVQSTMASWVLISPLTVKPLTYSFSGVMLKYGLQKCPSSFHQLFDHSKVLYRIVLTQKCSKGRSQSWQCHASAPLACGKCERDRKEVEKSAQRALEEKRKRDEKNQKYLKEVAKVEEEMEQMNQKMRDARLDSEQNAILAEKRMDLAAARERANMAQNSRQEDPPGIYKDDKSNPTNLPLNKCSQIPPGPVTSPSVHQAKLREHIKTAVEHNKSPSMTEWQRQKDQENAHNRAVDKIMEMIGLENVKAQVLGIKAKVETSIRQDTDLRKERLGLVLLGNPGTGIFFVHSFNYPLTMQRQDICGQIVCSSSDHNQSPFRG
jgi:hypothetical protein